MKSAETTVVQRWVAVYWDDMLEQRFTRYGNLYVPSRQEAIQEAAKEARRQGAPGQALVYDEYNATYLADRVVVLWNTPIMSEQPADKKVIDFNGSIIKTYKVASRRLGNIPQ